jgi:hypothetical protein
MRPEPRISLPATTFPASEGYCPVTRLQKLVDKLSYFESTAGPGKFLAPVTRQGLSGVEPFGIPDH